MSITREQLLEAIRTSHDECAKSEGGCIHAEAITAESDAVQKAITEAVMVAMMDKGSPALSVFVHAFHIGYRLHQLETQPIPLDKVN